MSGVTYSDVATYGGLREIYAEDSYYQDHIQSSIYNFLDKATEAEVEFDGKAWKAEIILQLNESYSALNDDERLPDPGVHKSVFASYNSKLMYSQIEATTYAATRGYRKGRADGKYMDSLVKGSFLTFVSNVDFDIYANGRGYRATTLTATAAAASFTVTFSTRLRAGMLLDWYDSTLTTKRGSVQIDLKGIDRMNRTVYVSSTFGSGAVPAGATAGDILVVYGALAPNEPTDGRFVGGFDRVSDNSVSYGGLSPSSYAQWMSTNINAGGANPSELILQRLNDSIYIISGRYPRKGSFNPVWKRSYLTPFLNQRRFTSNAYNTGASDLSWSPVKMGEDEKKKKPVMIEWLEDKNHAPADLYMWCPEAIMFATDYQNEPALADEDGAEFRLKYGYDTEQAFIRFWGNIVTTQRNAFGKISNQAVGAGVI